MQVWAVDVNGDWLPPTVQKSAQDAILQNVITRLREQYGDCFFDVNAGIDWLAIFGNRNYEDVLYLGVKSTILGTDGVTALNSYNISFDSATEKVNIIANISTIYSQSDTVIFNG